MRIRSILVTAGTAAALSTAMSAALSTALPAAASAATGTTELVDRSLFDATPERTVDALHLDGPTAGELGGAMDLVVRAKDGTLPVAPGACEPVRVKVVVTVRPGAVLAVRTTGEACADPYTEGFLQVNAGFDRRDVTFRGCRLRKARLVGPGLVAASQGPVLGGGQASFSGTFRW
jgi:hypothetical protein